MGVIFQDVVRCGVKLKYSPVPLSRLSVDELRLAIHELNQISGDCGCVVFEGESRRLTDLVIFAGNLERFSMLSAARENASRVIYFQDTASWWYGGSDLLPDIEGIAFFVRDMIQKRPCLAFGQSSGGYAALALGGLVPHIDVLACSPQTFSDKSMKEHIYVSGHLAVQRTPDYLMDIADLYTGIRRSGYASAIFSASEYKNPYQSHFWLDHLHMAKLVNITSIDKFLSASSNHSMVYQRAAEFSVLLKSLMAVSGRKTMHHRSILHDFVGRISDDNVE